MAAWLCTRVTGGRFRADVGIKAGFPAHNYLDNASRVRSLLCTREALARPPGMAGFIGGSDLTWGDQRAEMNGIRKGNPCGAAMYTSLTCLTLFTAEGSGSKQIATK